MGSFSLFEDEERLLERAEALLLESGARPEALRDRLTDLVAAFRQSLMEQERLVRLGDRQQEKLRQAGAELLEKNRLMEAQSRHLLVLNTELGHEIEKRKDLEIELRVQATTDPLTGLYNRRRFLELGTYEVNRESRGRRGLSLLVLDLDHFKAVNDRHGHAAGDEVLRRFATICKTCLRAMDSIGRIGGEEFAILLPETPEAEAAVVAEKVRREVADCVIPAPAGPISVTVSIGLVTALDQETFDQVLARGDACLYAAKWGGRNRVATAKNLDAPALRLDPGNGD